MQTYVKASYQIRVKCSYLLIEERAWGQRKQERKRCILEPSTVYALFGKTGFAFVLPHKQ